MKLNISELNLFTLKARIKKIMQMDEEVGKVSSPVPVMVCILLNQMKIKTRYYKTTYKNF